MDRHEQDVVQAWQVTRMGLDARNPKRGLRPLQEYMIRPKRPKTLLEQRAVFEQIAAQYGLTIRKRQVA